MHQSTLAKKNSTFPAEPRTLPKPPASAQRMPVPAAVDPQKRESARRTYVLVAMCAPMVAVLITGVPYYLAAPAERVRHAMHAWLRPSGYIGQSAGILAFAIFVFLWLYPLRKKWKALRFTGSVGKWLDVHVTTALTLPLLLAIHAAWRSDGLIGIGLISMLVVIASGVVGRYLYTRIPRAQSGVEFTREEVSAKRDELIDLLARTTGLEPDAVRRTLDVSPPEDRRQGPLKVLTILLTNDLMRWRLTHELKRRWKALAPANRPLSKRSLATAVELASKEIALTQQARMLTATQRVFRYWHVAHRPFAVTALVAVVVHVVVVIGVGATWFR